MTVTLSSPYSPRTGVTLLDLRLGIGHAPRKTAAQTVASALEAVTGVDQAVPAYPQRDDDTWQLRVDEVFSQVQRLAVIRLAQQIVDRENND